MFLSSVICFIDRPVRLMLLSVYQIENIFIIVFIIIGLLKLQKKTEKNLIWILNREIDNPV